MEKGVKVTCPYCAAQFLTGQPPVDGEPSSVECVPYTRDIGRFDPQTKADWFSSTGWSRIGKDYLPLLNWEHFGVLRLRDAKIHIQYRVQMCQGCRRLFDVYANYSGISFSELWPHIFAPTNDTQYCDRSPGDSWLTYIVKLAATRLGLPAAAGALIAPAVLLVLCALPVLGLVHSKGGQPSALAYICIGTQVIGAAGASAGLVLMRKYVSCIANLDDLARLLRVANRNHLAHWRNYTISRIVGVQRSGSRPQLTQVDVVVGVVAVFALSGAAVFAKAGWVALLRTSAACAAVLLLSLMLSRSSLGGTGWKWTRRVLIAASALVPAWFLVSSFLLKATSRWDLIAAAASALFWIVIIYVLGVSAWIAINSTVYIFSGITRIPMRVSPFDGFFSLRILRTVQSLASGLMLTTFLTMMAIMSVLVVFETTTASRAVATYLSYPSWLTVFMLVVVLAVLLALAVGSGRPLFIYLSILYLALASLFSTRSVEIFGVSLSTHLFLISLFFAGLIAYQSTSIERVLRDIVRESKRHTSTELSQAISTLESGSYVVGNAAAEGREPLEQRMEALIRLNSLFEIADSSSLPAGTLRRAMSLSAPLIASVAIQIVTQAVLKIIGW